MRRSVVQLGTERASSVCAIVLRASPVRRASALRVSPLSLRSRRTVAASTGSGTEPSIGLCSAQNAKTWRLDVGRLVALSVLLHRSLCASDGTALAELRVDGGDQVAAVVVADHFGGGRRVSGEPAVAHGIDHPLNRAVL